jgi:hypothetical protein
MTRAILASLLLAATLSADVRVNIRLGTGHPLRRPGRTVILRPPRPIIRVRAPIRYAPIVIWNPVAISIPPRERLLAEDRETIRRAEDWVDMTLNVHGRGDHLYLRIDGRAQLDFAEIQMANGQVHVVDFNERDTESGSFHLFDIHRGREVAHVRLVARARTPDATITVLLAR